MLVLLSSLLFVAAFFAAAAVIAHSLSHEGARVLAVLRTGGMPTLAGKAKSQREAVNFVNFATSRPPLRAAA